MIITKVNSLKLNDSAFPEILKNIQNPPSTLYWAGANINTWLDRPKVAIVGSRKISSYGRQVTERFASELARLGVVIISGLAFGVDFLAHKSALESGGLTAAILPTSLNKIYPSAHVNIANQIIKSSGTLVSEYEQSEPIYKTNFIERNRLVSGLADVLLITEAALKSGSLHTARFALDQGKTVMAVPGNINSLESEGCNNLIKSGATPATSLDDVLFELNIKAGKTSEEKDFKGTAEERIIMELISEGVSDQEDISTASQLDGPTISSTLTMLEIGGHIRPAGGGRWIVT